MLVFVFLARVLGPDDFGRFSYALAIATLVSVVVNYGLVTFSLREIGARKEHVDEVMGEVLAAKVILTLFSVLLAVILIFFVDSKIRFAFLFLFAAQIIESFSEFYNVVFRIDMQGKKESLNASLVSAVHVAIFFALLLHGDVSLDSACLVFLFSRLFGFFCTLHGTRKIRFVSMAKWINGLYCIRHAWAYALEIVANTAYSQLDSVIILSQMGPAGLGLYQAGMKLVQGASRIAPILAQTILPRMAEAYRLNESFVRVANKGVGVFFVVGCFIGVPLIIFKSNLVNILFGPSYSGVVPLMPLFGVILIVKYLETGCGLVLVAMGLQSRKVFLVIFQLISLVCIGVPLMSIIGIAGWQLAIIFSTFILLATYVVLFFRGGKNAVK